MGIGMLIGCSVAFAAGVVVGVFLNEKEILTTEDLRYGVQKVGRVIKGYRPPKSAISPA